MVWRAHLPSLQDEKDLAKRRRNSEIPLGWTVPSLGVKLPILPSALITEDVVTPVSAYGAGRFTLRLVRVAHCWPPPAFNRPTYDELVRSLLSLPAHPLTSLSTPSIAASSMFSLKTHMDYDLQCD